MDSINFEIQKTAYQDLSSRNHERTKPRKDETTKNGYRHFEIHILDQPLTTDYGSPSHLLTFCYFPTPETYSLLLTAYYASWPLSSVSYRRTHWFAPTAKSNQNRLSGCRGPCTFFPARRQRRGDRIESNPGNDRATRQCAGRLLDDGTVVGPRDRAG